MRYWFITALSFLTLWSGTTVAQVSGDWASGRHQGYEVQVTKNADHDEFQLSCNIFELSQSSSNPLALFLTVGGHSPTGDTSIIVNVDKSPFTIKLKDGYIVDFDCPSCLERYSQLFAAMRAGKTMRVTLQDGSTGTFSLRGSSDILQTSCIPKSMQPLREDSSTIVDGQIETGTFPAEGDSMANAPFSDWTGTEPKDMQTLLSRFTEICLIRFQDRMASRATSAKEARAMTKATCQCMNRFLTGKDDETFVQIVNLDLSGRLQDLPPLPGELKMYLEGFDEKLEACETDPGFTPRVFRPE
ncbi:hypothetical protein [Rhizobium rhizophilum]|uniref:Uncharacterized protein n=1 Tax=Rhizobium rhizophilum TaxID=1850373 RepID=A0ABY2QM80_9HYPH|nr:hypothetical protein [Rhizobium rhizophilum]THV09810.1 hypothetical protein E9677_24950 [Rhizobium rhizophilum]